MREKDMRIASLMADIAKVCVEEEDSVYLAVCLLLCTCGCLFYSCLFTYFLVIVYSYLYTLLFPL